MARNDLTKKFPWEEGSEIGLLTRRPGQHAVRRRLAGIVDEGYNPNIQSLNIFAKNFAQGGLLGYWHCILHKQKPNS
jgi:hypothetical protein